MDITQCRAIEKAIWETPSGIPQKEEMDSGEVLFHIPFDNTHPHFSFSRGGAACSYQEYTRATASPITRSEMLHAHDCFFLLVVLKGETLDFVEGECFHVTENDLLLLSPNTMHHNVFTEDSSVVFLNIEPSTPYQSILQLIPDSVLFSDFFAPFLSDRTTKKAMFFPDCTKQVRPILMRMNISGLTPCTQFTSSAFSVLF